MTSRDSLTPTAQPDPTWRRCHCPDGCEGGPECLDDEGGPLPREDETPATTDPTR